MCKTEHYYEHKAPHTDAPAGCVPFVDLLRRFYAAEENPFDIDRLTPNDRVNLIRANMRAWALAFGRDVRDIMARGYGREDARELARKNIVYRDRIRPDDADAIVAAFDRLDARGKRRRRCR